MSTLLDSDALIFYHKKQEPWRSFIRELLHREDVFISIVSIMEICAGWNEEQQSLYLPELYEIFTIVPLSHGIAARAGLLRYHQQAHQKREPKPMDVLIAATAMEHGHKLITNNRQDFNLPGLDVCRELWRD